MRHSLRIGGRLAIEFLRLAWIVEIMLTAFQNMGTRGRESAEGEWKQKEKKKKMKKKTKKNKVPYPGRGPWAPLLKGFPQTKK